MNNSALASEHLSALRDRFKDFVHGGGTFSGEDMAQLVRRLQTITEIAKETEEENRILARHLAIAMQNRLPAVVGGNVVAFPGAHRGPRPIGGGDAA